MPLCHYMLFMMYLVTIRSRRRYSSNGLYDRVVVRSSSLERARRLAVAKIERQYAAWVWEVEVTYIETI
jgi:hypothetical protein